MKGQVSMEFLLVFLLTVAFFSFILSAMIPLKSKTEGISSDIRTRIIGEEIACTAEAVLNSGSVFSYESEVEYWLQEDRLVMEVDDKTYVVEGTFIAEKEGEPV